MKHQSKTLNIFTLLILFCVISVSTPDKVLASTVSHNILGNSSSEEPDCWPLDIVLLMDQSLSIFNNDPDSYRAIAANRILTLLISNRRAQCPKAKHRFGLVTFGDHADTILDLVPIDINQDTDREEWLKNHGYITKIEEAAKDRTQNATDFEVAFERAEELFANAPDIEDPIEYGVRRQVVVLLTDGNPDGVGDIRDYMCDLTKYLNSAAWDDVSIWVMPLNARGGPYLQRPGCKTTIRDDWESVTQEHGGELKDLNYNEHYVPAYMKDIIDAEFGQPGIPLPCGEFYVDPYLKQVQFTFQKNLEDERKPVILEKLDNQYNLLYRYREGQVLEPGASSDMIFRDDLYYNRDLAEMYVFEYPLPGPWRFEVAGLTDEECEARVEARENREEITVELSQPENIIDLISESPYYDQDTPELEVHIWNKDRQIPFESDELYPLEVKAMLTLPSGNNSLPNGNPLPVFELSERKSGVWVSSKPMLAPEVGQHILTVVGKSKDGEGNFGYHVFTETVVYEVLKRDLLTLKIDHPDDGDYLSCNTIKDGHQVGLPITVSVQLLDVDEQPVVSGEYLSSDLNQSFQTTLLDVNNVELDRAMLSSSSEEVGEFDGALLTDQSEVEGCGKVIVSAKFVGGYNIRQFTMPITHVTASFIRKIVQGVDVTVDPEKPKDRLLLHPNLWAARPGGYVNPIPLEFKLSNLEGEELNPTSVAIGNPRSLYTIELFGPGSKFQEVLSPTIERRAGGFALVTTGGLTMTEPGNYHFVITAQPKAFRDDFMPANESPIIVEFERYDTFITNPTTALIVFIIIALILLIVIGLIVYGLTGGPGGKIQIFDHETGQQINKKVWRLSKARFFSNVMGIRNKVLKSYKIKVIKAKKTQPLQGKRAALITMIATENGEILLNDEPLDNGQKIEVILPDDFGSVDIQYV